MTQQQRRRGSDSDTRGGNGTRNTRSGSEDGKRTRAPSAGAVARRASAELSDLLDREPEGIISVERTDDGWRVGVEFVETRRIPDTTDVLAEYSVDADRRGQMVGYRRVRQYIRGRPEDGR